jgi:hypothetical protein
MCPPAVSGIETAATQDAKGANAWIAAAAKLSTSE